MNFQTKSIMGNGWFGAFLTSLPPSKDSSRILKIELHRRESIVEFIERKRVVEQFRRRWRRRSLTCRRRSDCVRQRRRGRSRILRLAHELAGPRCLACPQCRSRYRIEALSRLHEGRSLSSQWDQALTFAQLRFVSVFGVNGGNRTASLFESHARWGRSFLRTTLA